MLLRSVHIRNYKGFDDSGPIEFGPGFNILVGKNNSGKTSFLEALSFARFGAKPHRSIDLPRDIPLSPVSICDVTFEMSGAEMRNILLRQGDMFHFPLNRSYDTPDHAVAILEELLTTPLTTVKARCANSNWNRISLPSHGLFDGESALAQTAAQFRVSNDRQRFEFNTRSNYADDIVAPLIGQHIAGTGGVYVFRAERLNVGLTRISDDPILSPDAQNLPAVLLLLMGRNPARFERLTEYIHAIFPSIYTVRAHQRGADMVEVQVWQVDPVTERDDLAVSLNDSGTGVGQVIAILYVAVNSNAPRTIVIDEPNSFLHPGAARKLIEILKSDPLNQHQYIIATHSSEIIGVAEPTTLHLSEWTGNECGVRRMDAKQVTDTRRALLEVGARLSDVFGSEKILWVEGPTEQECFPKILRRLAEGVPLGTSIIAVRSTDEIAQTGAEAIWDIYRRISTANALLPSTIAFSFDHEARPQKNIDDLLRASNGMIKFLPRRTYENYLLHLDAVVAVLNETSSFEGTPISNDTVEKWLDEHGGESVYFRPLRPVAREHPDWKIRVNAPRLLQKLFSEISDGREHYRKTTHSIRLTEWLLENCP